MEKRADIQLVISDGQQDNSKQIAQIEAFIRQKPDLLIVAPNEGAPLANVMGRAMAAQIPVICLERDLSEPNYTTFVGADNLAIGKMAGEFILSELKKKNGAPRGKIIEIRGLLGVPAEMERYNGAHDVLEAVSRHPIRARSSRGLAAKQRARSHGRNSSCRARNRYRLRPQ